MNLQEWTEHAQRIDGLWPATPFGHDNLAAYFEFLAKYDADDVRAAIDRCVAKGSAFAPSCAEIIGAIEAMYAEHMGVGKVSPDEAVELALAARKRHRTDWRGGLNAILEANEDVAAWVSQVYGGAQGWHRLGMEPVDADDPKERGMTRSRMAKSFREFAAAHEEDRRSAAELVSGVRGPGQLRQVSPMDALPQSPEEEKGA